MTESNENAPAVEAVEERPEVLESEKVNEEPPQVLEANAEQVLEDVEATEDAEESDEMAQWGEEFSPEELAELFGGEENVPAATPAAAPTADSARTVEVEVIEAEEEDDGEPGERLQKLLARAGVASRRAGEELIRSGRVRVNGEVVTELGRRFRAGRDRIEVDGLPLKVPGVGSTVVILNKPRGTISSRSDPQGRATVMQLLPKKFSHLHPIGRLDFDTSGLLLLTDDGDLTNLLLHPSHGVEKRYHARVRGVVDTATIDRLQKGVRLEDGVTQPCRVRVKAQTPSNALLEITLREGRNRQVRRMLQAVGHPISALRRVRVGPIDLSGLTPGGHRELLPGEVHLLKKAARAPKPALKGARPYAYKPRPSKAEDKTLKSTPTRETRESARDTPRQWPREREAGVPSTARSGSAPGRRAPEGRASERGAPERGAPGGASASGARSNPTRAGAPRPRAFGEGEATPRETRERRPVLDARGDVRDQGARSEAPRYRREEGSAARPAPSRPSPSPSRPASSRPVSPRPAPSRPTSERAPGARSATERRPQDRPSSARPPARADRAPADRPQREEGNRRADRGPQREAAPRKTGDSKLARDIEKRWK